MGSLVLLLGTPAGANGAAIPTIVAVRVWPARDYTRVTIESDQALAASHLLAEAPHRLVVDLNGLELSAAAARTGGQGAARRPLHRRRARGPVPAACGAPGAGPEAAGAPEQFTLAPVAAYQHRLVFDLFPTQEADPLLALIRDKEAAEQRAAHARCRTRWAS
jgi:N-acetylmuramoyl-L-alanine amidase